MTTREQLQYLIGGLLNESYDIRTFCMEFTRIYNLETDYSQLSHLENSEYSDLCDMAGRFTTDKEELAIPNMYYSKEEIFARAQRVRENLSSRENGILVSCNRSVTSHEGCESPKGRCARERGG